MASGNCDKGTNVPPHEALLAARANIARVLLVCEEAYGKRVAS